jgi:hypothetical protein
MLQAQENSRARSTRGGGGKKVNKVAKKPRKKREKSAKKIKADDDSEVELGSDGEVKQKEKKGGFHKQYHLSASLAELVNAPTVCSLIIHSPFPLPSLRSLCIRGREERANFGWWIAFTTTGG